MGVQVIVSHHVRDFDTWKAGFDEHEKTRREFGCSGHTVYQSTKDPGKVIIVNRFEDMAGAKGFLDDPGLPEVMKRAGVDVMPDVHICREIEDVEY